MIYLGLYILIGVAFLYVLLNKMDFVLSEGKDFVPSNLFEAEAKEILEGYDQIFLTHDQFHATLYLAICSVIVVFGWAFLALMYIVSKFTKEEN